MKENNKLKGLLFDVRASCSSHIRTLQSKKEINPSSLSNLTEKNKEVFRKIESLPLHFSITTEEEQEVLNQLILFLLSQDSIVESMQNHHALLESLEGTFLMYGASSKGINNYNNEVIDQLTFLNRFLSRKHRAFHEQGHQVDLGSPFYDKIQSWKSAQKAYKAILMSNEIDEVAITEEILKKIRHHLPKIKHIELFSQHLSNLIKYIQSKVNKILA